MSSLHNDKQAVAVNEAGLSPQLMDGAWKYLDTHRHVVHGEPTDLRALRRRIDWRILPWAFLCYTMQFIDKVLINVSSCSSLSSV